MAKLLFHNAHIRLTTPEAFADVDLNVEYDEFFQAMYGVGYPDYQPAD